LVAKRGSVAAAGWAALLKYYVEILISVVSLRQSES
jgi:hypothetical protein